MKRILDAYCRLLRVVLTLLMVGMVVPVLLQVVSRHSGIIPRYIWTEEIARFCFVWIVMVGSMIAVREGTHFHVDVLPKPKTGRGQGIAGLIVHGSMAVLALVFAWHGLAFAQLGWQQTSEMGGINMLSIYISFPLAGVTWLAFLAEKLAADLRLIDGVDTDA
jgi:TRAP-type C4-dicarboxylate transport system permease small subunit